MLLINGKSTSRCSLRPHLDDWDGYVFILTPSCIFRHVATLHFPASFGVRWSYLAGFQPVECGWSCMPLPSLHHRNLWHNLSLFFYPFIYIIKTLEIWKVGKKERAYVPKSSLDWKPPRVGNMTRRTHIGYASTRLLLCWASWSYGPTFTVGTPSDLKNIRQSHWRS